MGASLAAGVLIAVSTSPSSAQRGNTITLSQFIASPQQLLQLFPNGGPKMALLVRRLAIADGGVPALLIGLLASAHPQQKSAILEGLAHAANLLVLTNHARGVDIQQQIASFNDPAVNLAFAKALGDEPLGAVLGGVGGGVGGQTSSLSDVPRTTGPAQPIGTDGTKTATFTVTSSVPAANAALARPVSATTIP